jgi:hypothetical protein
MILAVDSIFLDFKLPNATTWFYFSFLLAVALFFKFARFLSVRNLDVVTLFLLVPGLLLLQEAHTELSSSAAEASAGATRLLWFGYLWLVGGSAYFLVRCLLDLVLERRPALGPNLNLSGLAWLGGTLFISLVSVAIRHQEGTPETVGKGPASLEQAKQQIEKLVDKQTAISAPGADFDTRFWVECGLAVLCHLAVVTGLIVIGWRHFQDPHTGMAAATFYLLLPYTAFHVGQVHHVWPAALLTWLVACYRKPIMAGFLLGLAAGTVFFPSLLFPVWASFYWKRGAGRFTTAFVLAAGVCLAVTGTVLWMNGELSQSLKAVMALGDWQPWKKPTTEGIWSGLDGKGVHWGYRIPVFIAYLAYVLTTAFWPRPKNLAHVLALSAVVLIGIQFWYADQGGVFVLWYLPILLLVTFRPNLSDRRPPPLPAETDWLLRMAGAAGRLFQRLLGAPAPTMRV